MLFCFRAIVLKYIGEIIMTFKNDLICNCVTYGLCLNNKNGKKIKKMWNKQFWESTNYKNEYIKFCWDAINMYANEDEEFKNALHIVQNQNKLFGKSVFKSDLPQEVVDASSYIKKVFYKDKKVNFNELHKNFAKAMSKTRYGIYIPNDVAYYLRRWAETGFEQMTKNSGHNVIEKGDNKSLSLQFKPDISETGNKNSTSAEIVKCGDTYYLRCWDCTDEGLAHIYNKYDKEKDRFTTSSGYVPRHKFLYVKIKYNKNDIVQKQLLEDCYRGAKKISRTWIRGEWHYVLQINFEETSPIVKEIQHPEYKVAVNVQTETIAYCDNNDNMLLAELSPSTPRVVGRIQEIDVAMDRSRYINNPNRFNENGTAKSNKELNEPWNYSNNYKRLRNERRELYRVLSEQRKINHNVYAKEIARLGNWFIFDKNSYKAWGTKTCRGTANLKKRVSKTARKRDYTKQIHDRAPR